jgi:hypothetical protein
MALLLGGIVSCDAYFGSPAVEKIGLPVQLVSRMYRTPAFPVQEVDVAPWNFGDPQV